MKRGRLKTLPSSVPGHASDNASRQGTGGRPAFRRIEEFVRRAENYPELKASEQFTGLQSSLNSIEDNIQNARRYYNAVVRDFNTRVQSFPTNIIAGMSASAHAAAVSDW